MRDDAQGTSRGHTRDWTRRAVVRMAPKGHSLMRYTRRVSLSTSFVMYITHEVDYGNGGGGGGIGARIQGASSNGSGHSADSGMKTTNTDA